MTLYAIKPRFQVFLGALADRLAARGVGADALTLYGLILGGLAGAVIAVAGTGQWLWLAPPLLFGRIACNALDGMVARLSGSARPLGAVLNELSDRGADLLIFGGLIVGGDLHPLTRAALLPLLLAVSYLGILGQTAGGSRRYEGPLGKADRMLLLGLYCLLVPLMPAIGPVIGWMLVIGLLLTAAIRLIVTVLETRELGCPASRPSRGA